MLPNHSSSLAKRARQEGRDKSSCDPCEDVPYGLYHSSAVGSALIKTLNTLVEERGMSKETAKEILDNFDREMTKSFKTDVASHDQSDTTITGNTLNYNISRSNWRIDATDIEIEIGAEKMSFENARFLFRTSEK